MNLDMLQAKATDLYFARYSESDEATMQEVERDLRIFIASIERNVEAGDLKKKIGNALIAIATK